MNGTRAGQSMSHSETETVSSVKLRSCQISDRLDILYSPVITLRRHMTEEINIDDIHLQINFINLHSILFIYFVFVYYAEKKITKPITQMSDRLSFVCV